MLKLSAFLVVLLNMCIVGTIAEFDSEDLAELLEQINEEDRVDFLRYHVNHGYDLTENHGAVFALKANTQTSKDIYDYFITHKNITDVSKLISLRDIVCIPAGCVDLDDPTSHP